MVFYRKYRPQTISELDLSVVREKLTAILSSKDLPHAFLFAGPKGLGKTSSARILAKAINCEQKGKEKDSIRPCNTCSSCISITNGSNVDVLEIDAASNRGIDEIRDLRERIKFSPSSLQKKVYIIDEVHMLTTEAFNALLKTLEEPPAHVVFVLCTTETGKLPATIISRTFIVRFEKPTREELARSLKRVVEGEKLELEDGVLDTIADLSDGAFRDGAKILEELSLQSQGKKIKQELLEALYKTGSIDSSVQSLLEDISEKKIQEALSTIQSLSNTNTDFKIVIEKMADVLHAKLLEAVSKGSQDKISSLQNLLGLLDEAYKNLRGAVLPQLPLELAVIEFCLERKALQGTVHTTEVKVVEAKIEEAHPSSLSSTPMPTATGEATGEKTSESTNLFKKLVDSVNLENKILAGLLRSCKLGTVTSDKVIIHALSQFHLGKLSEQKNKEFVEKKLAEALGGNVKIEILLN